MSESGQHMVKGANELSHRMSNVPTPLESFPAETDPVAGGNSVYEVNQSMPEGVSSP
jgi:hypothetical protein